MSLLTGTLPSRHGVNKDYFSLTRKEYPVLHESINSIPEILKSHNPGINTIKFARLAKDLGFSRGFDIDNYFDPFLVDKEFNKLLEEIDNQKENDFFLFVHTWMVHAPYTFSHFLNEEKVDKEKRSDIDNFRKLYKEYRGRRKKLGKKVKELSDAFSIFLEKSNLFNTDDCIDMYDSGIRYVDQYIGRLIEKTKQLGIYDDLMIVVVSDHGEHFQEHYRRFYDCHGYDYYEEFIKVPIIIKYPGQSKRKVLSPPVSLIDVVPTILDYYKINIPSFIQGESLDKPYSKRKTKYIISEAISGPNTETKMIRLGHLKYMISMKKPGKPGRVNWEQISRRRLYDMKSDPSEEKNLYWAPEFKNTCLNLEKMLKAIIENSTSPFGPTKETKVDKEFIEHMKSLGYL
jgi:arylsulfatase A-like enzyme